MAEEDVPPVLEFDQDLNNAEPPEPLPAGEYVGMISNISQRTSQRGNEYLEVAINIGPDQFPVDYQDGDFENGETLYYRRLPYDPNSKRSRYQLAQFFSKAGVKLGKSIDTSQLIGKNIRVETTVQDDMNDPNIKRPEIRRVLGSK